jgi:hypothetical protein
MLQSLQAQNRCAVERRHGTLETMLPNPCAQKSFIAIAVAAFAFGCVSDTASTTSGSTSSADAGPDANPDAAIECDKFLEKVCGGICVSKADPAYGCTPSACEPCAEAAFVATFRCEANTCKVGACTQGRADCDSVAQNGCETDTTKTTNCGACGNKCKTDTPFCNRPSDGGDAGASAQCTIACAPPTEVCGGDTCTDKKTDENNCGACGNVCPPPQGGSASCMSGKCGQTCPNGLKLSGSACLPDPATCLNVGERSGLSVSASQCCSTTVEFGPLGVLAQCACNRKRGGTCKTDKDCCTGTGSKLASCKRGASALGSCE